MMGIGWDGKLDENTSWKLLCELFIWLCMIIIIAVVVSLEVEWEILCAIFSTSSLIHLVTKESKMLYFVWASQQQEHSTGSVNNFLHHRLCAWMILEKVMCAHSTGMSFSRLHVIPSFLIYTARACDHWPIWPGLEGKEGKVCVKFVLAVSWHKNNDVHASILCTDVVTVWLISELSFGTDWR